MQAAVVDGLTLNIRAYQALDGTSVDWRYDLATLLRSDAPIEQWLRLKLADAIENKTSTGPALDLKNRDSQRRRTKRVAARFEWMTIGRWMDERKSEGCTVEEAVWRASEHFGVSEGKCKEAWGYYPAAILWIRNALLTEAGALFGEIMLESIYHQDHAEPNNTPFANLNPGLVEELQIPHSTAVGG